MFIVGCDYHWSRHCHGINYTQNTAAGGLSANAWFRHLHIPFRTKAPFSRSQATCLEG